MKTGVKILLASFALAYANSSSAHDIGHGHEHAEGGWNTDAGFVSDVDIKAKLWNPRGKSQEEIDARADYVATFFDGSRTEADRAGDDIRRTGTPADLGNLPARAGAAGARESRRGETRRQDRAADVSDDRLK